MEDWSNDVREVRVDFGFKNYINTSRNKLQSELFLFIINEPF